MPSGAASSSGTLDGAQDALDLLNEVSGNIGDLLATWAALAPVEDEQAHAPDHGVSKARTRGTTGKEILEQSALRLAATAEVARVLRRSGHETLAVELDRHSVDARTLTIRLAELSRGVSAIDLQYSDEFADHIDELGLLLSDEIDHEGDTVVRVDGALGRRRAELRTAAFIRGHAPIYPSDHRHRYQDLPVVSRLRALYDQARNNPGPESRPTSDVEAIKRYES